MKRFFLLLFSAPALFALSGCSGADADETAQVFDHATLHAVEITVDASHLAQLETDLDNRVPCTIVYDGERVDNAGIRQKGNAAGSLAGKPSFSVKLDELDDTADLHGLHKLLLNGSGQDPTFLRELLGSDVHDRAGIPAARIAHATLSLNGVDHGIYVVAEAIDKDFLQRHFGKDNDEGNLYEGPCCGDFVGDIAHMELEDEKKDGRSRDDITALAQIIQDAPDAELAIGRRARLDFGRFMTSFALEALLDHWDGYAFRGNNFYLYDNPADGRFVFLPHGMDRILEDPNVRPRDEAHRLAPAPHPRDPDARRTSSTPRWRDSWRKPGTRARCSRRSIRRRPCSIRAKAGAQTSKDLVDFDAGIGDLRAAIELRTELVDPSIPAATARSPGSRRAMTAIRRAATGAARAAASSPEEAPVDEIIERYEYKYLIPARLVPAIRRSRLDDVADRQVRGAGRDVPHPLALPRHRSITTSTGQTPASKGIAARRASARIPGKKSPVFFEIKRRVFDVIVKSRARRAHGDLARRARRPRRRARRALAVGALGRARSSSGATTAITSGRRCSSSTSARPTSATSTPTRGSRSTARSSCRPRTNSTSRPIPASGARSITSRRRGPRSPSACSSSSSNGARPPG